MGQIFAYSLTVSLTLLLAWGGYRLGRGGSPRLRRAILLTIYALALLVVPIVLSVSFSLASDLQEPAGNEILIGGSQRIIARTPTSSLLLTSLAAIYACGVIICLALTVRELAKVMIMTHGAKRRSFNNIRVFVIERDGVAPFSFANTIVVGLQDAANAAVLTHEAAHISRRHTLDILIAQTVAILCWYCPAAWRLRAELRMVHEFEADSEVISRGFDIPGYSRMLIERASGSQVTSMMVSAFNYKCLKQRISMMQKPACSRSGALRILLPAIAVVAAAAFAKSPVINAALNDISRISLSERGLEVKNGAPAFAIYGIDPECEAVKQGNFLTLSEFQQTDTITIGTIDGVSFPSAGAIFCADKKVLKRLTPQVVKYMVDGKMISAREFNKIEAASLQKVIVSERTIIAVTRNHIDYDQTDPLGEALHAETNNN